MDVDSTALEDPGKRSEQESRLSEEGIHFEVPSGKRLDATARRTLRQLHLSLGHPSNKDLERFMRLGGVKQDVSEACGWIRCISCAHGKRPKSNRVGNIPPSQLRFGDEICLDCFHVHDSENRGHWFLSMLDRATSFHLITRINDHSPYTLSRTFNDSWCRWAGAPSRISVDMEGGFRTEEFWTQVADGCCPVVPIAGTAHWQAGKVERHGQTIKRMLEGVIRHGNVHGIENMEMAGHEVAQAKNELCREHGWSPNNLVFGREPRAFGEVHSNGNPYSFHPDAGMGGSDVAKHVKYRYHARLSYIKHQAKHMLLRTLEHRTRNTRSLNRVKWFSFGEIRGCVVSRNPKAHGLVLASLLVIRVPIVGSVVEVGASWLLMNMSVKWLVMKNNMVSPKLKWLSLHFGRWVRMILLRI